MMSATKLELKYVCDGSMAWLSLTVKDIILLDFFALAWAYQAASIVRNALPKTKTASFFIYFVSQPWQSSAVERYCSDLMCLVRKMWGMVLKASLATSKWKTWLFMCSPQLLQVHLSFFEHPCFWQSPAFECWRNDSWKHLQIVWLVQLSHKFHNCRWCKVKLKAIMCPQFHSYKQ